MPAGTPQVIEPGRDTIKYDRNAINAAVALGRTKGGRGYYGPSWFVVADQPAFSAP